MNPPGKVQLNIINNITHVSHYIGAFMTDSTKYCHWLIYKNTFTTRG